MISVDPVERHLFLEGIFLRYGYDFRQYSETAIDRRLAAILRLQKKNLLGLLQEVLNSTARFREVLPHLTVNTTEFFRDPLFFRALREKVFPILKTYPSLRIWSAGCSTGEELLSLAILLEEEGLLARSVIYATDISPQMIRRAKEGIFDAPSLQSFIKNYSVASGLKTPSEYYTAEYGLGRFRRGLLENVVFSEHNLVTDGMFVEAHLICCRNVLIYFNRELQERVLKLMHESVGYRGFLGLGSKESLRGSNLSPHFELIDERHRIFQVKAKA